MKKKLDAIDRKILELLQTQSDWPINELAAAVHLTPTPCWRRVQRLKELGILARQVALVDRQKVNLGVTVFVAIRTRDHDVPWLERFRAAVQGIGEIVEVYRMSGDVDYLLKVVVPDIAAYDLVYKQLIQQVPLSDVSSSFAMEELKFTTAMPLTYVT
ncbi:Lrp/AsnC family transcriptional regulator [Limnohabitans sp. Rim47]|jgi:Lrp/AsnC family transcriptional regulator|uniref:Lrp/AsnC family transcriptional regulator n=1 Tax=Limnohabitans sp. Rim47 TaxID=1100721 RepID=UPI00037E5753|nr:Lrp/AsnC family transcriptional regulator [Limnohabitans sp. Rim47]MBP6221379.1 Lrp/AsnC family transcriptional regulator [Limnohabitans sp.]MBP6245400.1 Lrp/AsnC family transcriptional regulator [Limnohabitans sp.]